MEMMFVRSEKKEKRKERKGKKKIPFCYEERKKSRNNINFRKV